MLTSRHSEGVKMSNYQRIATSHSPFNFLNTFPNMPTSKTNDILQKVQESIQKAELKDTFSKKGEILELRDGVATVVGLDNAMFSEIVTFENDTKGLILDLAYDKVGVLILGDDKSLKQGDKVKTT
jgi:F-type H+-transporting ATPase subunit alpha